MLPEDLAYYAKPGPMTLASVHVDQLANAPCDVPRLADWIHGLLIHEHLAWLYDQELTPERRAPSQHNRRQNQRYRPIAVTEVILHGRNCNKSEHEDGCK